MRALMPNCSDALTSLLATALAAAFPFAWLASRERFGVISGNPT